MRNLKKVLALVLAMAMSLSLAVTAGAAFNDQDKIVNEEAVDMCVALNIINGRTDGSFDPAGDVTRAEMAKMICIALNGGKEPATATKAVPTYADIDGHWAEGYIEYCSTKGIVAGVGGGNFNPNGNVTGSQAAKMLLVALGYNADVEKMVGANWELYTNVLANQDGLYEDLEAMDPSAALSRDNAAQMIWNALQAGIITKTSSIDRTDGSITDTYDKTSIELLNKQYKGIIEEGVLTAFNYDSKNAEWTYTVTDTAIEGGYIDVVSSDDYTDLLGQKVKAVYTVKNTEALAYGIFATTSEVILTGIMGDLPTDIANADTSFKLDGTTYKLDDAASATEVYTFAAEDYAKGSATLTSNSVAGYQEFTAVDLDGDGKIDFFMVSNYSVLKVNYVKADGTEFKVNTLTNKVIAEDVNVYDGIAKNDWVVYTPAANTADETDTFVKANTVNGKVTAMDGSDACVNDAWYTLTSAESLATVKAGTTLTDAVEFNGYLFDADTTGTTNVDEYVVVITGEKGVYGSTAQVLFSDNTKKVVNLADDWSEDLAGDLCTYEVNKDGEYELAAAPASTNFDLTAATGTVKVASSSSAKAGFITAKNASDANNTNYAIADDAVIFVKYDNGAEYKVITGATMKTLAANMFTSVSYVLGTDNSSTGGGDVNLAYVVYNDDSLNTGDSYYAYVTKVIDTQNADEEDVKAVTLWTADGEKKLNTVKVSGTSFDGLVKGAVVEYTVDTDGCIDEVLWAADANSTSSWTGTDCKYATRAITMWDGSAFAFGGFNEARHELDDDIVYLFIDDSESAGMTGYTSADIAVADDNENGNPIANAFVVLDKNAADVLLVVYDVDNAF